MNKQVEIPIEDDFKKALQNVKYPGFDLDIIAMELVLEARREGKKAIVRMRPVAAPAEVREQLENQIAEAVATLPGVSELELDLPEAKKPQEPHGPSPIEGVSAVVPVASGKGGVGKSTVAVNLALGLAAQGLKVGLLDLDLYGPSVPVMMGANGAEPTAIDNKIAPIDAQGIKVLSIGFMMGQDKALIWRGGLVMKAVRQLLHDVAWAPLDVLVLDLPPGTGDVQITMVQEVPVTGAVVVTTPQDVALADAIRAVDMFEHTNSPVLGIVENMSYFICPDCGSRHEIFGHGTVGPLCSRLGVDFLGELPLETSVRERMDQGKPVVNAGDASSQAYKDLAEKIGQKLAQTGKQ